MATEETSTKPNPAWKIILVGLPVFLALSGVVAMCLWWKGEREMALDPRLALAAAEVSVEELDDHLYKLTELIGPRDWESPEGRKSLRQTIAFIEGTLSPQNYGFAVKRGNPATLLGELWPTIWVEVRGNGADGEVLLVAVPYDREAARIAAVLGAVNDLRDESMPKTVRFVFFPAALYAAGEGKAVTDVLGDGESHLLVPLPDLPEPGERLTGASLMPVAQALVAKVRNLAQGG